MADVTKKIGLSLGADICWPIAFTEIMNASWTSRFPWGTTRCASTWSA